MNRKPETETHMGETDARRER